MRHLTPLLALVAPVLFAGCGTGVFTHRFEIAVSDPSGRLGPPPIEMSLFDQRMGSSEEWARKTAGTSSPGAPFVARYDSVETKMVLDSTPAARVTAGLWLPGYEKAGYFNVVLEPRTGQESTVTLPFAPWRDHYPEGANVVPLKARVRADAADGAWIFHVTIDIP